MDTILIIISALALVTIGLLAFCLTESKGENTKHARRGFRNKQLNALNRQDNRPALKTNTEEVA